MRVSPALRRARITPLRYAHSLHVPAQNVALDMTKKECPMLPSFDLILSLLVPAAVAVTGSTS
jgi:hypothetical protein